MTYSEPLTPLEPTFPGVPISLFTGSYLRVKELTTDEAVVSHAVGRHGPSLLISDDGKRVRRRQPFFLLTSDDFTTRTVYVEGITMDMDIVTLMNQHVGPVERTLAPQILASWNDKQGSGVSGKYPDLSLSKQAAKRKIRRAGYCFVIFQRADDALKCVQQQQGSLPPPSSLEMPHSADQLRILSFQQHQTLTEEYRKHLSTQHRLLHEEMSRRKNTFGRLEYSPGLVAEFSGVHPRTNRKVLKRLFGRIADVAYLDFVAAQQNAAPRPGDGTGWIRFKRHEGAQKAVLYFSGTKVVQANPDDSSGVLQDTLAPAKMLENSTQATGSDATTEGKMTIFGYQGPDRPKPRIRLRLLTGKEEEEYWMKIAEQKEARVRKDAPVVQGKGKDKAVQEGGQGAIKNEELPPPQHVRFSDSEDDEEDEEMEMEVEKVGSSKKRGRESEDDEGEASPKKLRS